MIQENQNFDNSAMFRVVYSDDFMIVLVDLDQGKSVTNDAVNVISRLSVQVPIAGRRVYYRDTDGRYDELRVCHDKYFMGFAPCSDNQQLFFADIVANNMQD